MTDAPPGLLVAMRGLMLRRGVPVAAVTGYREVSFNIGFCETCSETVTNVRVYYVADSGGRGVWDYMGDFGELIRALTDDEDERAAFDAAAERETEDQRWERISSAHSVEEALEQVP